MSSASTSPDQLASSSAQLFMSYEANFDLQKAVVGLATELEMTSVPDEFTQKLSGIQMQGEVPFHMQERLGNDFVTAEVETNKKAEEEASVRITLASRLAQLGVKIFTEGPEVEYGANKRFRVYRSFDKKSIGHMPYSVLADLLDSAIPTTDSGELSRLAEDRFAYTFDSVAVRMGDILRSRAKRYSSVRQYMAHALLGGYFVRNPHQIETMADKLKVETAGLVTTYTLDSFQTYEVGGNMAIDSISQHGTDRRRVQEGRIIKNVRYSFKDSRYAENRHRRSRKNLNADIRVALISPDFRKPVLDSLVAAEQDHFEESKVFTRALEAIVQSRPFPYPV